MTMAPTKGSVICAGLGPGDPDLMSLRAARAIGAARHVAYFRKAGKPGQARRIVEGLLAPGVVEYPMEYPVTTELPFDSVEYRVGVAQDGSVQALAMRYSDATAVTAIDTIIFHDAWDAQHNVALWGHEVKHVEQFRRWGLMGFARAYVRDHQAVEAEAYAIGDRIKAQIGGG